MLGYNSCIAQIGVAGYPLIGGALAVLGWNYPFLLFFISMIIGALALKYLNLPENRSNQELKDYLSNSLKSLLNYEVMFIFVISIITFITFYGSYVTYFPILLEEKFAKSSVVIGAIMSVMAIVTAITASRLRRLVDRFGIRRLLVAAFMFYGLGLSLMPLIRDIYVFIIPITAFGIGHGLSIPCIYNLLAGIAPAEYRATYMSVNGSVFRLGQTLGPIIMGAVYSAGGIDAVFFVGAVCSLFVRVW